MADTLVERVTGRGCDVGQSERCNYTKESPRWTVTAGDDENGIHTAQFHTPTRHHYRSTAPPAPGPIPIHISEIEPHIGIAIAQAP